MGLFTKKSANKPVKEGAIASFATSKRFPVGKVLASLDQFDLGLESAAISDDWAVAQAEPRGSGTVLEMIQEVGATPPVDTTPEDEYPKPMSQSDWIRSLNRVQESPFEAYDTPTDTVNEQYTDMPEPFATDPPDGSVGDWDTPLGDGEYTESDLPMMMPQLSPTTDETHQTLDYLSRPSASNELTAPAQSTEGISGPTLAEEIDEDSFWDMMADQSAWSSESESAQPENGQASESPESLTHSETGETEDIDSEAFEPWALGELKEDFNAGTPSPEDVAERAASLESLYEATSASETAGAAMLEAMQGELDRANAAAEQAEPEASLEAHYEAEPHDEPASETPSASKDFGQRIRLLMERSSLQETWVPSPEAVASALAPAPPPPITLPLTQTLLSAGGVSYATAPAKLPASAAMVIPFVSQIAPPAPAVMPVNSVETVVPEPVAQSLSEPAPWTEPESHTEDTVEAHYDATPEPVALVEPHAYVNTLAPETRQSLAEEGIEVIAGEQIAPDLQVILVMYQGITALMADNGEHALLLKAFETNPLATPEGQAAGFHVAQQAVTGNRVLFTVQAGMWQGVLTLDSDEVSLQLEY